MLTRVGKLGQSNYAVGLWLLLQASCEMKVVHMNLRMSRVCSVMKHGQVLHKPWCSCAVMDSMDAESLQGNL